MSTYRRDNSSTNKLANGCFAIKNVLISNFRFDETSAGHFLHVGHLRYDIEDRFYAESRQRHYQRQNR
jgi:hypothetical protein